MKIQILIVENDRFIACIKDFLELIGRRQKIKFSILTTDHTPQAQQYLRVADVAVIAFNEDRKQLTEKATELRMPTIVTYIGTPTLMKPSGTSETLRFISKPEFSFEKFSKAMEDFRSLISHQKKCGIQTGILGLELLRQRNCSAN